MTVPLLELDRYQGRIWRRAASLHSVSLKLYAGGSFASIGSNGAGKIDASQYHLRCVADVCRIDPDRRQGHQFVLPPESWKAASIQVPEGRRLFAGMSVRENLLMGAFLRRDSRAAIRRDLDFVYETFPRLTEKSRQDASTMSGGEQQMCAIGRGIMARPKLLMIDELSLGLAPKVVEEITGALRVISQAGVSLLIVEQDVFTALEMTNHGFVLDEGRIALDGPSDELFDNPRIRHAYLGVEAV